uniref:Uncharacterized protein n=1 Tax=Fagus sylvatica TaxID=28930 RepID=A0A2N9G7V9_FAGSY
MSDFDVLGIVGKLALPTFARFRIRGNPSLDPVKFLAIREFHVVHGMCLLSNVPGLRGSTCCESGRLCAQAWQRRWENSGIFSKTLFRRPVFTRVVDVAPDVGFRRSWYRRKAYATYFPKVQALHRGELGFARYDLANGGRWNVPYAKGVGIEALHHVSSEWSREWSVRFSFWSGQRSGQTLVKLGQPWSNLVKILQTLGNVSWDPFQGFGRRVSRVLGIVAPVGSETAWSNLGQTGQLQSNLVNPWSNLVKILGNVSRTFFLGLFDVASPRRIRPDLVRAVSFCVPTPEKIPGLRSRAPESSFAFLSWRLEICSSLKSGGSTVWHFESQHVEEVNLRLQICLSLKLGGSTVWHLNPNMLRGDLTWGLPKLQIGWFQRPNTLRGDLTWGLPKLQIGWFNGLESQSKHVEGCKSGGSTVWNLSPNKLRGDLTWGLPKLQIGWFNGLESQSKQVEGCKSGGSTVWNLSPNKLRSDLTWGLPKLQIGWFNGLESQSKQMSDRCAVVAEIVAGPHALDSCECMNIEGAMRAPSRWLLLCLLGRSALRIPYFRLSYLIVLTTCSWSLAHLVGLSDALDHLVGRHFLNLRSVLVQAFGFFHHILDSGSPLLISGLSSNFSVRGKIAPVWYNKINEFLIPGLRYYHRFGRFCKRCPFAWMM